MFFFFCFFMDTKNIQNSFHKTFFGYTIIIFKRIVHLEHTECNSNLQ